MTPFHRMFTLNNVAIQYPHALVERVPICMNLREELGIWRLTRYSLAIRI